MVETFGNRSGQGCLFELLFGPQAPAGASFIGNDDIRSINTQGPDLADLEKWDKGTVCLCAWLNKCLLCVFNILSLFLPFLYL